MPADAKPAGVVKTLAEVARAFDVSHDQVRKEWRANGMPGSRGKWDLAAIAEWKQLRDRDPDDDKPDAMEDRRRKLAAEARIKEAEAERRERMNRLADGELVPREDVEAEVAQAFLAVKRELAKIPRKMLPRFPDKLKSALAGELTRLIERALEQLANTRCNLEHDADSV